MFAQVPKSYAILMAGSAGTEIEKAQQTDVVVGREERSRAKLTDSRSPDPMQSPEHAGRPKFPLSTPTSAASVLLAFRLCTWRLVEA
jgi:hypothetical protein